MMTNFGVTIVKKNFKEMAARAKEVSDADAEAVWQQWNWPVDITNRQLLSAIKIYITVKEELAHDPTIRGVDLQAENVEARLAHYPQFSKMKGFRHVLQGETDKALMLKPAFKKGISLLSKYNFTYDILIYPDQLKYAAELVKEFPDQMFVIDHVAKPGIKNKKIAGWKEDIQNIAEAENVYCKISGMVTEADLENWKKEDIKPYIDIVAEAFGTNRIMYGSDWPVCLLAASYDSVLDIVKEYFASFSKNEQDNFFGKNAFTFYNLN